MPRPMRSILPSASSCFSALWPVAIAIIPAFSKSSFCVIAFNACSLTSTEVSAEAGFLASSNLNWNDLD